MGWLFSYPHNLAVSMNNKEEEESNYQEKQKQKKLDVIDWLFLDLLRVLIEKEDSKQHHKHDLNDLSNYEFDYCYLNSIIEVHHQNNQLIIN